VQLITVEELTKQARGLGRARFIQQNPHPFIVLEWLGTGTDELEMFSTADGGQLSPFAANRPGPPSPRAKVGVLVKRTGANEFANMITIGRAGNNDVPIEVSSVSKFHAYFTGETAQDKWFLHDAGSSNGTWIDGERVGRNKAELRDGSTIQLGPDARVRFFTSKAIFDLLAAPPGSNAEGTKS
jgi:hypothetical protein